MPFGASRPFRIVFTSRLPSLLVTAYTLFRLRLLTNTVPLSPSASERASGMPSAQTSTLKPAGTLSLSIGTSLDGRPVRIGAIGCSVDDDWSGERPCCHEGAGAGAAAGAAGVCANAGA